MCLYRQENIKSSGRFFCFRKTFFLRRRCESILTCNKSIIDLFCVQLVKEFKVMGTLMTFEWSRVKHNSSSKHLAINWKQLASMKSYIWLLLNRRLVSTVGRAPVCWTEGTGEGCGFLCSLKLPYLSTNPNNFVGNCRSALISLQTTWLRTGTNS